MTVPHTAATPAAPGGAVTGDASVTAAHLDQWEQRLALQVEEMTYESTLHGLRHPLPESLRHFLR